MTRTNDEKIVIEIRTSEPEEQLHYYKMALARMIKIASELEQYKEGYMNMYCADLFYVGDLLEHLIDDGTYTQNQNQRSVAS